MNAFSAGLVYAALAFAIGATLGPVRELALAPRIGAVPAAALEAAAMAVLLWAAARFVLARLMPAPTAGARAAIAAVALACVVALELGLGLVVDATGLSASRPPRGEAERAIGLALLAWLALLPFVVRRGHAVALP